MYTHTYTEKEMSVCTNTYSHPQCYDLHKLTSLLHGARFALKYEPILSTHPAFLFAVFRFFASIPISGSRLLAGEAAGARETVDAAHTV